MTKHFIIYPPKRNSLVQTG